MQSYLTLLKNVRDNGIVKVSAPRGLRTVPITTRSLFCQTIRHDMSLGFPLLSTKKINYKMVLAELLWFLSGDESITELKKFTNIWDAWADKEDKIPSAYGVRWRHYQTNIGSDFEDGGEDQIKMVLDLLTKDPSSRRGVVIAWHPFYDFESALPCCHYTFVVNILNDKLNLHVTMRSTDVPIGLPYNIASYATLLLLFANWLHVEPGELGITMVDCHIYDNQLEGVKEQLSRTPYALPELFIPVGLKLEDCNLSAIDLFELKNYQHHAFIKYPVAL